MNKRNWLRDIYISFRRLCVYSGISADTVERNGISYLTMYPPPLA